MLRPVAFAIGACFITLPPTLALVPHQSEVADPQQHQHHHALLQRDHVLQPSGALLQRHHVLQPSGSSTTTSHENFFQRMGNAFGGVIVGLVMIIFSLPLLWLNEKRNARYEALIVVGEQECRDISADKYDAENTNWLVHVTGDTASTKPVQDEQFNVRYESGVIRLSSVVEIYQWVEIEKSESIEKETFGGGKTTTTETWQEYQMGWHAMYNSGQGFKIPGHRNSKPDGIEAGSKSQTCARVEFGQGFLLQDAELQQLQQGTTAKLGKTLESHKNPKLRFEQGQDGKHYFCQSGIATPQLGDTRVSFDVLNDGPATVVGLQAALKEVGRAGFLPYRVIHRSPCPCFAVSEEQEKEMLLEKALQSREELASEDMWKGWMMLCCCACNCVQFCFSTVLTPELHHVFGSSLSKAQAFADIKNRASMMKWILRLVGWLVMFFGLSMTFSPFTTALKLFPFGIGSFLSSMAGAIIWVFSFLVTLVISVVIVALAYLMYRPMLGLMTLAGLGVGIAGILAISSTMHAK